MKQKQSSDDKENTQEKQIVIALKSSDNIVDFAISANREKSIMFYINQGFGVSIAFLRIEEDFYEVGVVFSTPEALLDTLDAVNHWFPFYATDCPHEFLDMCKADENLIEDVTQWKPFGLDLGI